MHSKDAKNSTNRPNEIWSGEATRHRATEETQVDVTIGDETATGSRKEIAKERPVWLLESTVINTETSQVNIIPTKYITSRHPLKNV